MAVPALLGQEACLAVSGANGAADLPNNPALKQRGPWHRHAGDWVSRFMGFCDCKHTYKFVSETVWGNLP